MINYFSWCTYHEQWQRRVVPCKVYTSFFVLLMLFNSRLFMLYHRRVLSHIKSILISLFHRCLTLDYYCSTSLQSTDLLDCYKKFYWNILGEFTYFDSLLAFCSIMRGREREREHEGKDVCLSVKRVLKTVGSMYCNC